MIERSRLAGGLRVISATTVALAIGWTGLALAAPRAVAAGAMVASPLRPAVASAQGVLVRTSLDAQGYQQLKELERVTLTDFAIAPDRRADLELRRVDVFTPDAQIVAASSGGNAPLPRPDVVILSGHVKGHPGSFAFLSLSPYGSNGLIQLGGETFVVAADRAQGGREAVAYNLTTLPAGAIRWREWACGTDQLPVRGVFPDLRTADGVRTVPGGQALASVVLRQALIAIDTDWEFTGNLFDGDTAAASVYVATLIGAASEIYSREVDTSLQVSFLRLWEDSGDPWNQSDIGDQLDQFRIHWNNEMNHVERHAVHLLSGRGLGGGIAYLPGLCAPGWDYGISANLNGVFPYPLVDNSPQNWDIMVFSHELGHNFGAPHTHSMVPRIDNCAGGDCSVTPNGTIMSYCHLCPGGLANILLQFHDRIKDERILPYITFDVNCDLSIGPEGCLSAGRPATDTLGKKNRALTIVPGNAGQQTVLRVQAVDLPAAYSYLENTSYWVTEPQQISENSGAVFVDDAPGSPWFWAANLSCSENAAHVADWTQYGTVHVYHPAIVPEGFYAIQAADAGCDLAVETSFSIPLGVETSEWGDVVLSCQTNPCGPSNGSVDIITDAVAVLRKFSNLSGAPIKARCDLVPATPNHIVDIQDVIAVVQGFQGFAYDLAGPVPCP